MELKSYQKEVIADLAHYLELVVKLQSPAKAYQTFWNEKNVVVGRRAPCMRQGAYRRWQDLHRRQFSAHDF